MNRQEYREYLNSDHWKNLRAKKKKSVRAVRCAICGSTERIHTHHLRYKNIHDVEVSDLRLLCERCHTLTHDLINTGKLDPKKYETSNGIFTATKTAVKKALGLSGKNLFAQPHE